MAIILISTLGKTELVALLALLTSGNVANKGQLDHRAEYKGNASEHPHIHRLDVGHSRQILQNVSKHHGDG
jgi:hypothetical protein